MMTILTKIANIVKRAFVSRSMTDDKDTGLVQVSYLGKAGIAEVVSPYGISTRLPEGTQVILFAVQGQENNRAVIGYSQQDRFKDLEEGEVVTGIPSVGNFIKFHADGSITIQPRGNLIIEAPNGMAINIEGDVKLTATGDIDMVGSAVNLGSGGQPIARLGDSVLVDGVPGTITSAGTNTST